MAGQHGTPAQSITDRSLVEPALKAAAVLFVGTVALDIFNGVRGGLDVVNVLVTSLLGLVSTVALFVAAVYVVTSGWTTERVRDGAILVYVANLVESLLFDVYNARFGIDLFFFVGPLYSVLFFVALVLAFRWFRTEAPF